MSNYAIFSLNIQVFLHNSIAECIKTLFIKRKSTGFRQKGNDISSPLQCTYVG